MGATLNLALVVYPLAVFAIVFVATARRDGLAAPWAVVAATLLAAAAATLALGASYRAEVEAASRGESVGTDQRHRILAEEEEEYGTKVPAAVVASTVAAGLGLVVARRRKSVAGSISEVMNMSERARVVIVVIVAVVAGAAGLLASQYSPVFGGLAVVGRPWSPARQSLIGEHVLAFVAAAVAAVLVWPRLQRRDKPPGGDDEPRF